AHVPRDQHLDLGHAASRHRRPAGSRREPVACAPDHGRSARVSLGASRRMFGLSAGARGAPARAWPAEEVGMGSWNPVEYDGQEKLLRVGREEGEQFIEMADDPEGWERATGAGWWQVRDVVGHLVDTTEEYFRGFDAARAGTATGQAYGLPGMAQRV